MNKKVCECGNDEFEANQLCRINVIVDSGNFFIKNAKKSMEDSCYDSDAPYGEYSCTKCGVEYANLNKLPKTKYYEELLIDTEIANKMQELLSIDDSKYPEYIIEHKIKEDAIVFSRRIRFENGYEADLNVCTGQNNAYVDFILFDNKGNELTCCPDETLLGDFWAEIDNSIFDLNVSLK